MGTVKPKSRQESLIEELEALPVNHFLNAVEEARKARGDNLDRFVADTVAKDIQAHLAANGYKPTCPECGSEHVSKNGKRGEVQRYRCKECKTSFTAFTGTFLAKTRYTWAVWKEVVRGLLEKSTVEDTRQTIEHALKCTRIDWKTVWSMRMRIMYAASKMPSPILRGVIEIDDTFIREGQKGSRCLENPLPNDISKHREPRYGRIPSKLGIRGNEFATVTTMVDQSRHCVCRILGRGVIDAGKMEAFVREHTADISFACSDAESTYADVFKSMNVAHYIRPSRYDDIIFKAGYEQPSHIDAEKAEEQIDNNARVLERLWESGLIDHIDNRGKMTYAQFQKLKRDNDLNMGLVNELHKDLKAFVEKERAGVATRYLPYYVGWFEYVKNRRFDMGRKPISSDDAEDILIDLVNARITLPADEFETIKTQPLKDAVEHVSGRYIHLLDKNTRLVREAIDNPAFAFGEEDGVESFGTRAILSTLPDGKLRDLAKLVKVKGAANMARWTLIDELLAKPNIKDHLFIVAAENADKRRDCAPTSVTMNKYFCNRSIPPSLLPKSSFTAPEAATTPIAFIDVETTGVKHYYDEILSVAVITIDGEVLFDGIFKPKHRRRWKKAQAVNGISPTDVADKPLLSERKEELEEVLAGIGCLAGWNVSFDLKMLYSNFIDIPLGTAKYCDLMPAFCQAWGKVVPGYRRKEREKLENAAEWLGFKYAKHTAKGDASVLIDIWNWLDGKIVNA